MADLSKALAIARSLGRGDKGSSVDRGLRADSTSIAPQRPQSAAVEVPSAGHLTGDPADLIASYHERLAIAGEAGDVLPAEAARIASTQVGSTIEGLAERQVADWRDRLQALPAPIDPRMHGLVSHLLACLSETWATEAARLGFTNCDLFGGNLDAPFDRPEHWGLAITLAWCPHHQCRTAGQVIRSRVTRVLDDRAWVLLPTGRVRVAYRFGLDPDDAALRAHERHDRIVLNEHGRVSAPVWDWRAFQPATRH